jgi:quercetin dioxygenase-like cupin family protein
MNRSRREWCLALPAVAASAALAAGRLHAQAGPVLKSEALPFGRLPVRRSGGNAFREIFHGLTHENFRLEVHETTLAPGGRPHPPHHHRHEEMFLVREGTVEVTISGHSTRLGPGSAAFVASMDEHGIQNVGSDRARYFVVEMFSG